MTAGPGGMGGPPQHFAVARDEALRLLRSMVEAWGPPKLVPAFSFAFCFVCKEKKGLVCEKGERFVLIRTGPVSSVEPESVSLLYRKDLVRERGIKI